MYTNPCKLNNRILWFQQFQNHFKNVIISLFLFFGFCVSGCFIYRDVCTLHMCSVHSGQKRASDPLWMELWWLWAAPPILWRAASALNHKAITAPAVILTHKLRRFIVWHSKHNFTSLSHGFLTSHVERTRRIGNLLVRFSGVHKFLEAQHPDSSFLSFQKTM